MAILTFIGAAQQVTGSCYLLESPALGKILLDCGMHQGGDAVDRFSDETFEFNPADIDALVLSHAHLDHSGLIPLLVNQGFDAPIFCTRATEKLLKVMLEDAAWIYEKDLEYENIRRKRRGDKMVKPRYTRKDVNKALALCHSIPYREPSPLGDGTVCFHDAGHILGSAITQICFEDLGKNKTLVFSGDLGKTNAVLMNDPAVLHNADIVMMEGTYGNRNHRSLDESLAQLEEILHSTWKRKGNVMIPAFSVGRTQELLFHLGCMAAEGKLDKWQVFLDSPMAINITSIYDECMGLLAPEDVAKIKERFGSTLKGFLPNLHYCKSVEESQAINRVKHGAIIIAGSGMCTGGRIRHHFKARIWDKRNTVIFVGFQARGTLGRILVDGVKKVKMFRDEFAIRASIETLNGFSAHASQQGLTNWISEFNNKPRVLLVHGEPDALDILSQHLNTELGIQAEIPYRGQKIQF